MTQKLEIVVPDIGDFDAVPVIEVLVKAGDRVEIEDGLITLESDKATMDIPSPAAGIIESISIDVGDEVKQGTVVGMMLVEASSTTESASPAPAPEKVEASTPVEAPQAEQAAPKTASRPAHDTLPPIMPAPAVQAGLTPPHASPAIRRFSRELGVDLHKVRGTGAKGRILKEDVKAWVKYQISSSSEAPLANMGMGIPPIPEVDFSEFGETELEAFSRIKKISGPHLHRSWLNIPHVTHHDEADITITEDFRQSLKGEAEQKGIRITLLSFIMKALVACLKEFPHVNSSLTPDGKGYVLKKYFNMGMAVDTPTGLVVPVIRDVDHLSIYELSAKIMDVSQRAREGKLKPDEFKGGCMSISSLGGIGGMAFTPIVNAPEVAILGVTRAKMKPVWDGKEFQPRLMLPLDLSYDHRAVDGAEAARFMAHLVTLFSDVRRLLL
ncbi:MAG: dihydrolipoyllysine-residue acetyltransferase [Proteobacteria bacterium]|nr:dihydrolipoyllysine-residue acetyltransferase [Pseudomonadota bacterium]